MELKELIQKLDQIDLEIKSFNQSNFLTQRKLLLQPNGKVIIDGGDKIYKFYQIGEGYSRKLVGDLFKKLGSPIFLDTHIERVFDNIQGILLSEDKVEVIDHLSEIDLIGYMKSREYNSALLEQFGIKFFENKNAGYLNGDLKIFDGIWNLYPTMRGDGIIRLQDGQGNILIEEEENEWNK